jgi:peptidyl-prolyl cis-trans isomerase D
VTLAEQDKSAYAGLTSATVADAAFKAERGTYTSPAKGPLGWYVVHVDRVSHDEGKTLDQAREGIIKTLSAGKIEEVFANFQNKVADKASAGARFDELVKANGGEVVTTPLIVGSGADPKNPAYKPAPEAAAVLHDAFKSDTKTSSEPLIVPYGKTRDMVALYHVKAITPSGPVPLATIHDQVAHDAQIEAAAKAARVIAGDVLAKANKGSSLAEAMKATGMQLPPVDTMAANKVQLMQQQQKNKQPIPPPVREMFNIPLHHGKIVEFARHDGWYVIWLDNKKSMDASTQPGFIEQVQQEYGKAYGPELVAQFSNAVQTKVGAVKYPANIKALSAALTGNQGQ